MACRVIDYFPVSIIAIRSIIVIRSVRSYSTIIFVSFDHRLCIRWHRPANQRLLQRSLIVLSASTTDGDGGGRGSQARWWSGEGGRNWWGNRVGSVWRRRRRLSLVCPALGGGHRSHGHLHTLGKRLDLLWTDKHDKHDRRYLVVYRVLGLLCLVRIVRG